jgi:protein O-GlcNAc transferase
MGMSEPLQYQDREGASSPSALVEEGRALHRAGNLDAAEQLYKQALALDENCAEAHQLMAVIAGQRGRFDEAIAGFRRTIALEGPTPDRLYNLAEAYRLAGDYSSALTAYNQVLTLDAGFLDAYRTAADMASDAADRASVAGDTASALRMKKLAAHYLLGLGHARFKADNLLDAEEAYRQSVALDPESAEPYNNLGTIALRSHRPLVAEAQFRRALALEPKSAAFLNNLGMALQHQIRTDEAAEVFRRAMETDSSFDEARINLEERMLQWLLFRSDLTPEAISAAHCDWGRLTLARIAKANPVRLPYGNARDTDRRLKIGYVGLDPNSSLATCCIEALIAHHDPKAVEVFVFAASRRVDANLRRLKELAGQWRETSMRRPQDLAGTIRTDGIDILIDLAGHLPHNRLDVFALKPAPVALTWIGYPNTTGLSTVDYRITDEFIDPPGADELYAERLHRIRGGSFAYHPPESAPAVTPLPARAPGAVTFGYFDHPLKIAPAVIQTWSAILKALPDARLLLLGPDYADDGFVARLHADFQASGIEPRRVPTRHIPEESHEHFSAYAEVDIGLDPFPYNGSLFSTCESRWMGVPVVALSGDRASARVSASTLAQVGLERLICDDADDYVATAVQLAEDLNRLRTLREGMRDRMRVSPIMDERGFARRFEAALRDMWRRWCQSAA